MVRSAGLSQVGEPREHVLHLLCPEGHGEPEHRRQYSAELPTTARGEHRCERGCDHPRPHHGGDERHGDGGNHHCDFDTVSVERPDRPAERQCGGERPRADESGSGEPGGKGGAGEWEQGKPPRVEGLVE